MSGGGGPSHSEGSRLFMPYSFNPQSNLRTASYLSKEIYLQPHRILIFYKINL